MAPLSLALSVSYSQTIRDLTEYQNWERRHNLGTNIMCFVLQVHTDLASAESELLDERGVAIK
jgi:hypothetical protein